MVRDYQRGKPALGKVGYFRMTQGEHEAIKAAAEAAGMSLSAYVRQRLGLDAPEPGLVSSIVAHPTVPAALLLQMPVGSVRSETAPVSSPSVAAL